MIQSDISRFEKALQRHPDYPPGGVPRAEPDIQIDEDQDWENLTDRQRRRIEMAFVERHFDGDFLWEVLDAGSDATRAALLKRIQGLWRTHRAVELDR